METVGKASVVVMNSWSQKQEKEFLTYRPQGVKSFNEDIATSNYAQVDHISVNQSWRNAVENIENTMLTVMDLRHTLQIADMQVKMASRRKRKRERPKAILATDNAGTRIQPENRGNMG
jgi:hypothetical protein